MCPEPPPPALRQVRCSCHRRNFPSPSLCLDCCSSYAFLSPQLAPGTSLQCQNEGGRPAAAAARTLLYGDNRRGPSGYPATICQPSRHQLQPTNPFHWPIAPAAPAAGRVAGAPAGPARPAVEELAGAEAGEAAPARAVAPGAGRPRAAEEARARLEELGALPGRLSAEGPEQATGSAPVPATAGAVPAAGPAVAPRHAGAALAPGAHPAEAARARLEAVGARPGRIGEGAAVVHGAAGVVEGGPEVESPGQKSCVGGATCLLLRAGGPTALLLPTVEPALQACACRAAAAEPPTPSPCGHSPRMCGPGCPAPASTGLPAAASCLQVPLRRCLSQSRASASLWRAWQAQAAPWAQVASPRRVCVRGGVGWGWGLLRVCVWWRGSGAPRITASRHSDGGRQADGHALLVKASASLLGPQSLPACSCFLQPNLAGLQVAAGLPTIIPTAVTLFDLLSEPFSPPTVT